MGRAFVSWGHQPIPPALGYPCHDQWRRSRPLHRGEQRPRPSLDVRHRLRASRPSADAIIAGDSCMTTTPQSTAPGGDSLDPRYSRQVLFPEIGEDGQRRLLGGSALIVGCGALGCTIAELLVRAGVGRVRIVDRDLVEATNLQRQILFDEADAQALLPKAEAAGAKPRAGNSAGGEQ